MRARFVYCIYRPTVSSRISSLERFNEVSNLVHAIVDLIAPVLRLLLTKTSCETWLTEWHRAVGPPVRYPNGNSPWSLGHRSPSALGTCITRTVLVTNPKKNPDAKVKEAPGKMVRSKFLSMEIFLLKPNPPLWR